MTTTQGALSSRATPVVRSRGPSPVAAGLTVPVRAGASFKGEHLDAILASPETPVGFFEVHAENYMGAGGPPHAALRALRERFPLSVHGVGMSIGSPGDLDGDHLARFAEVVRRYEPGLVSEHLAWATHDEGTNRTFLNDLLPVPYTRATLKRVVEHVDRMQDALGRTVLLENPATYLAFERSEMTELEFIAAVARHAGCGLLLDVNNVFVSCTNGRSSPWEYLDAFPLALVGEVHLAGHAEDVDDEGRVLLIDAHDRPVADPVWALYRAVIERAGPIPTLIEWDNDVPDWSVLEREAALADDILGAGDDATRGDRRGGGTGGSARHVALA